MPAAPSLSKAPLSQALEPLRLRYYDSPVPGWLRAGRRRAAGGAAGRRAPAVGATRRRLLLSANGNELQLRALVDDQASLIGMVPWTTSNCSKTCAPASTPAPAACRAGCCSTPARCCVPCLRCPPRRAAAARDDGARDRSPDPFLARPGGIRAARDRPRPATGNCGWNWWCCRWRACSRCSNGSAARRRPGRHRRGRRRWRRARRQPAATGRARRLAPIARAR